MYYEQSKDENKTTKTKKENQAENMSVRPDWLSSLAGYSCDWVGYCGSLYPITKKEELQKIKKRLSRGGGTIRSRGASYFKRETRGARGFLIGQSFKGNLRLAKNPWSTRQRTTNKIKESDNRVQGLQTIAAAYRYQILLTSSDPTKTPWTRTKMYQGQP